METLRTACLLWLSLTLLVECDQLVLGERCGAVSVCLVGLYVAVKGECSLHSPWVCTLACMSEGGLKPLSDVVCGGITPRSSFRYTPT